MADTTRTFTVDIAPAKRELQAGYTAKKEGQVQAAYLVTNTRNFAVRGIATPAALDAAGQSWVRVVGDKEKDFQPNQAQTVQLDILIPANVPKGIYKFHLVEANTADPAVDFTEGDAVNVSWEPASLRAPPRWPLFIAVAAVVLLAIGAGLFFLFRTHQVAVPAVLGESLDKAKDEIVAAGLKPTTGTATREGNAEVGTVLHVSPDVGAKAAPGSEVTMTLQDVKPTPAAVSNLITIHSYKGKLGSDAKADLERQGFKVNLTTTSQGDGAVNTVVSQDPRYNGDIALAPGTTITLTVKEAPVVVTPPGEGPRHAAWRLKWAAKNWEARGPQINGRGPSNGHKSMEPIAVGESIVGIDAYPGRGVDTFSFVVRRVDGSLYNRPDGMGFNDHRAPGQPLQHMDVPRGDFIVAYSCQSGDVTDSWTFYTHNGRSLHIGPVNSARPSPRGEAAPAPDRSQLPDGTPCVYELVGGDVTYGLTVDSFQGRFRPHFTPEDLKTPNFTD